MHQPPNGERTAHIRLYAGELRPRQQIALHRAAADGARETLTGRITSLEVVGRAPGDGGPLTPGQIGVLRGLPGIRTGDRLGAAGDAPAEDALFPSPTLETLVRARQPARAAALRAALLALADQDPLLQARPAPDGATSVLLHGEVQKEIIAATLRQEHGIEAEFAPSRVVCVERPSGVGEACEEIARRGHTGPWATVGLRVEPGARGSGPVFTYETELGALPHGFHQAVEETALATLHRGPHGLAVTDCRVVLTRSGFVGPLSTAGDFRAHHPRRTAAGAGPGRHPGLRAVPRLRGRAPAHRARTGDRPPRGTGRGARRDLRRAALLAGQRIAPGPSCAGIPGAVARSDARRRGVDVPSVGRPAGARAGAGGGCRVAVGTGRVRVRTAPLSAPSGRSPPGRT